jgi:hypothetical protein
MTEEVESKTTGSYPYTPLKSCLDVGEAVFRLGGARALVSRSLIASHLKEDERSQSLSFKLGSAKAYGIIDGRSHFGLTEAGKRYFLPTTPLDKESALREFVASPPAFRLLINRFDGSRVPEVEMLGNVLHREAHVAPSWKERVAGFFLRSAKHAGILDESGFLRFRASQEANIATSPAMVENGSMTTTNQEQSTNLASPSIYDGSPTIGRRTVPNSPNEWVFSQDGKTVRVITPAEISLELWNKLSKYVDLLKPDKET